MQYQKLLPDYHLLACRPVVPGIADILLERTVNVSTKEVILLPLDDVIRLHIGYWLSITMCRQHVVVTDLYRIFQGQLFKDTPGVPKEKVGREEREGEAIPSPPSPPSPPLVLLATMSSLRSRTFIRDRGQRSAVSSPSGVCGGAPAEINFGAFYP